ncbi:iron-containing alcohol dehydrogenase [Clostridium sp. MSJ-4]|uniref:Iron-containing alcohol dehydrogenase n=1 Tax=Clostridium simiarum TaxID=2841506 RepID=A0ABS6F3C2_9CLOT|nr:iron-containing alcohol dehydrogenase [Clostridium simiarum]MBU5593007.1 iron-containing alcohol dehydrogenase [Clostridium simiarum]
MFNYYQPTKIHFGASRLNELGEICKKYGKRCLLVTTADAPLQSLYNRTKKILESANIEVFHFDKVEPNPKVEIVQEGFHMLKKNPVDFVLAVGGGSSIDTAKAIAFTNGLEKIDWEDIFNKFSSPFEDYPSYSNTILPLISVPTTSGTGSQVTQAAVITKGDEKITFFHQDLFSKECIIDSELTLTLPPRITASTGFDAFTHAFESFINKRASLFSSMDSLKAMELVIENLPKVMKDPSNIEYREKMSMADTLAGRALANSGAAVPHPLSEIIGGISHVSHGEALAVVFPPYIKQSFKENKEKFNRIAQLFNPNIELDNEDNVLYNYICELLEIIGIRKKLSDLGVKEEEFEKILKSPILNHLPFGSREYLEGILKETF